MVGSRDWFSQGLALNNLQMYAFGQVRLENQGARLNWLLPLGFTESDPLPELLDNLAMEAGLRGAKFVIASTRVESCLFETLRHAGYCLCGWQSIWKISRNLKNTPSSRIAWFKPNSVDAIELTMLQRKLLSPATQSVTAFSAQALPDYALKIDGVLKGYARVNSFNHKVLIAPVLMNNLENLESVLAGLVEKFYPSAEMVYLLQTADSRWLSSELENFGTLLTPREELLVKHFVAVAETACGRIEPQRQRTSRGYRNPHDAILRAQG